MRSFPPLPDWVALEHRVAQILSQQELHGWRFDERAAWKLASSNQEKVKIQISDDDKFSNIVDENTILEEDNRTTETFSGLTNSKKYYARICAFLGDSNEQSAFTLANGSTTVPGRLLIVTKSITDLGKKPKLAWSQVSAEYDGVEIGLGGFGI